MRTDKFTREIPVEPLRPTDTKPIRVNSQVFAVEDLGGDVFFKVNIPVGSNVNLTVNRGIKSVTQPDDRTLLIEVYRRNTAMYWIGKFIEDNISTDEPGSEPISEPVPRRKLSISLMMVCVAFFLGVYGFVFSVLESGHFYLESWYIPSAQSALRAAASLLILALVKYLINNPPNWASPFPPEHKK